MTSRAIGPTTGRLVARIAAPSFSDLPDDAVAHARTFLCDSLLVGMASVANPASGNVLAAARGWDGGRPGACRVLGRAGETLSPHSAAVANGFNIHCLEWDGLHEPAVVIALCVTVAALVSECEVEDRPLEDVLLALVIGVEVAVFFGAAAQSEPRFFRPSVAGLMGAAIAVGRLRGFDERQLTDVLGVAYSQVSGTMQAHWEGSEMLPLQVGIAARAALTAADLVAEGITGPHDVVDGKFGYFKLIERCDDLDPYLAAIGDPWKITEVAHKPFPAGRATQATLTALMAFRKERDFAMEDVARLEARVPSLIELLVGRPWLADMRPAYARLCLEYVAPLMIRDGLVDPRRFVAGEFATGRAREDAAKIVVTRDDNPDPNALGPQDIVLTLADGTVLERTVDAPFGSPSDPMSMDDQLAKARLCYEVAGLPERGEALFAAAARPAATLGDLVSLVTGKEE